MNPVKAVLKWGINIPVNLDRAIAWATKNRPWSHFYKKGGTISFGFGAEEAETLYLEWIKYRKICPTLPYISMRDHPLGQFSEAICSAIQSMGTGRKRFHGLECWLNDPKELEAKYPGITLVVKAYLKSQGVRVA